MLHERDLQNTHSVNCLSKLTGIIDNEETGMQSLIAEKMIRVDRTL